MKKNTISSGQVCRLNEIDQFLVVIASFIADSQPVGDTVLVQPVIPCHEGDDSVSLEEELTIEIDSKLHVIWMDLEFEIASDKIGDSVQEVQGIDKYPNIYKNPEIENQVQEKKIKNQNARLFFSPEDNRYQSDQIQEVIETIRSIEFQPEPEFVPIELPPLSEIATANRYQLLEERIDNLGWIHPHLELDDFSWVLAGLRAASDYFLKTEQNPEMKKKFEMLQGRINELKESTDLKSDTNYEQYVKQHGEKLPIKPNQTQSNIIPMFTAVAAAVILFTLAIIYFLNITDKQPDANKEIVSGTKDSSSVVVPDSMNGKAGGITESRKENSVKEIGEQDSIKISVSINNTSDFASGSDEHPDELMSSIISDMKLVYIAVSKNNKETYIYTNKPDIKVEKGGKLVIFAYLDYQHEFDMWAKNDSENIISEPYSIYINKKEILGRKLVMSKPGKYELKIISTE